jgi:hypothetical protein
MTEQALGLGQKLIVGLVHHPVINAKGDIVTTSVTTLDVHDLARTCRTYGVGSLFIVTPLTAQKTLVKRLIRHWRLGPGADINPSRKEALTFVEVVDSIGDIMDNSQSGGRQPIVITTAARRIEGSCSFDRVSEVIAKSDRAVILFGTGSGLAPDVFERADYVLEPIEGADGYNHLPVRSAAAIILDRLLGR